MARNDKDVHKIFIWTQEDGVQEVLTEHEVIEIDSIHGG